MAEIKLGELAEQKGSNTLVKEFGKRMATDHAKAGSLLQEVASRNKISLPSGMDKKDRDTYDRLSKLSGAEFDKAYARHMVADHEKDVAAFKKEATGGSNPDIKKFAAETLPTLEDHLKHARLMQKNVNANTSASKTHSGTAFFGGPKALHSTACRRSTPGFLLAT
jgi:putative membrane protein